MALLHTSTSDESTGATFSLQWKTSAPAVADLRIVSFVHELYHAVQFRSGRRDLPGSTLPDMRYRLRGKANRARPVGYLAKRITASEQNMPGDVMFLNSP